MRPIVVIADDITGAAELAGLALSYGCSVHFTTDPTTLTATAEVTVLATDTRSMVADEAIRATGTIVEQLRTMEGIRLFKKCDSALRGHIIPELCSLMRVGYQQALILAANPSKGRRIERGIYTIDGTPIAETLFASDPEFPARTSEVTQLTKAAATTTEAVFRTLNEGVEQITIGESRSEEEIAAWVEQMDDKTLLVGAADAFRALLEKEGFRPTPPQQPFAGLEGRQTLVVCGSTVRHNLLDEPLFQRHRVASCPMPDAVFAGESPEAWIEQGKELIAAERYLLLRIPQQVAIDRSKALHLRNAMATTVAALVRHQRPDELIIEGGASAFAILAALGWNHFTVENQIAAGVVRLRHTDSGVYLTFKPGSYSWGGMFA